MARPSEGKTADISYRDDWDNDKGLVVFVPEIEVPDPCTPPCGALHFIAGVPSWYIDGIETTEVEWRLKLAEVKQKEREELGQSVVEATAFGDMAPTFLEVTDGAPER